MVTLDYLYLRTDSFYLNLACYVFCICSGLSDPQLMIWYRENGAIASVLYNDHIRTRGTALLSSSFLMFLWAWLLVVCPSSSCDDNTDEFITVATREVYLINHKSLCGARVSLVPLHPAGSCRCRRTAHPTPLGWWSALGPVQACPAAPCWSRIWRFWMLVCRESPWSN